MIANQTETQIAMHLLERFGEAIQQDNRPGYHGFLVERDKLLEVCHSLRDELGVDYLSSVTGVDYYPEPFMEVVYHFFKSTGGSALVLKTQVSRDNPVVPSVVSLYPGVEFQEREVWDLLGIRFEGHPDLRRILMWEGFVGHPLRKDWREPFFEEEAKPFKSRWPEGHFSRIEDHNPYKNNLSYPSDFDPEKWIPEKDELLYKGLQSVEDDSEIKTERVIVNLGPQHPSTHGVFRMVVSLDGERVVDLKPVMGYLHRNHEKIGERNTFLQNMPLHRSV